MKKAELKIENKVIGEGKPVYFIADIAANHDGDLNRAKELIYLAAEAGADAAKFQHFKAKTIVSDYGFKSLGRQKSHQSEWKKSVFEVYESASVSLEWTNEILKTCKNVGITFFTSPYSKDLVDAIDPFVPAYKIGSGDITWIEIVEYIAAKNKPYIIASGASTLKDVQRAVDSALAINSNLCLMQCNTNYTASLENFKYINLNTLKKYNQIYPNVILGLSDHTPGHTTVLGAVSLGAKMIEKHFTDDVTRDGPDHKFSMDFKTWREMVDRTKELEYALGDEAKKIEDNEKETVVLQRRSIRVTADLTIGTIIQSKHIEFLRPCPNDGIPPFELNKIIGKRLKRDMPAGDHLRWIDIE